MTGLFADLEWSCHFCDRVRPDEKIDVVSRPFNFGPVEGQENRRYCNDTQACAAAAAEWKLSPAKFGGMRPS